MVIIGLICVGDRPPHRTDILVLEFLE